MKYNYRKVGYRMLVDYFENNSAMQIFELLEPFWETKTLILYPSSEGYSPLDGHAMHLLMRLFPIGFNDIELCPVFGKIPPIGVENVIMVGRLWLFDEKKELGDIINEEYLNGFKYRVFSNTQLLNIETGDIYKRDYKDYLEYSAKDYGLIRYVYNKKTKRSILHVLGLGPIGTYGALYSLVFDKNTMLLINTKLHCKDDIHSNKIELLFEINWEAELSLDTFNPRDIEVDFRDISSDFISPNLPMITFYSLPTKNGLSNMIKIRFQHDDSEDVLYLSNNEFDILSVIARHTNIQELNFEEDSGFISYQEIFEAFKEENEPSRNEMSIDTIRATMSNIKQKMDNYKIRRRFKNLLLTRNKKMMSGRLVKGFRLRALCNFDND